MFGFAWFLFAICDYGGRFVYCLDLMLMLLLCLWFMVRLYLVVGCFRLCFDLRCACVLYLVFWWLWFVVFAGRCGGNSLVVFLVC